MMVYCISKIFGNNWSSMSNERTLVIFLNYLLSMESKFSEGVFQSFVPELAKERSCSLTRCRQPIFRGKPHYFGPREEVLDQIFLLEPLFGPGNNGMEWLKISNTKDMNFC